VPEFLSIFDKYIDEINLLPFPILTKHGQKLVGSWKTTIGVYDEATNLYAFENYGELERIRREVAADPDWIEYMKGPGLITHEICKIIEPLSFSPMK
jgi:hypothetical protein